MYTYIFILYFYISVFNFQELFFVLHASFFYTISYSFSLVAVSTISLKVLMISLGFVLFFKFFSSFRVSVSYKLLFPPILFLYVTDFLKVFGDPQLSSHI